MLDWFSGLVGYDASNVVNDRVMKLSAEGEVKWERAGWTEAQGSHDTNIMVMQDCASLDMYRASNELGFLCSPRCLRISGNPTKFLQGHNILGPSVSDLGPVIQAATRGLPEIIRPLDCDSEVLPAVQRTRVDVTVMVDLGSHEVVHEWLNHAAQETRSRHGRAQQSGQTVYWGQHSTRWTLKAYCKRCELEKHGSKFPLQQDILEWTGKLLRIELTLRRPELKDRGTLDESVIWEFMQRIEVGIMKGGDIEALYSLPRQVRDTFSSWLIGRNVRQDRPARTFYRQRRLIKDAIGVDISLDPSTQQQQLQASFDRDLFDIDVLRSRVVSEGPNALQQSLFTCDR